MTDKFERNVRHLRASQRVAAHGHLSWNLLFDVDATEEVPLGSVRRYSFREQQFDFWYALGFLIASDHVLDENEFVEIVSRIRDMPLGWRNAIYCDYDSEFGSAIRIITRELSGSITLLDRPILGSPVNSTEIIPKAAATKLLPLDSVVAESNMQDLEVSVQRASRAMATRLALHWWATDTNDDYAGVVALEPDVELASTLLAVIPQGGERRVFSIIVDAE